MAGRRYHLLSLITRYIYTNWMHHHRVPHPHCTVVATIDGPQRRVVRVFSMLIRWVRSVWTAPLDLRLLSAPQQHGIVISPTMTFPSVCDECCEGQSSQRFIASSVPISVLRAVAPSFSSSMHETSFRSLLHNPLVFPLTSVVSPV